MKDQPDVKDWPEGFTFETRDPFAAHVVAQLLRMSVLTEQMRAEEAMIARAVRIVCLYLGILLGILGSSLHLHWTWMVLGATTLALHALGKLKYPSE